MKGRVEKMRELGFCCRCSRPSETKCDALIQKAKDVLSCNEYPERLLGYMVMSLNCDYAIDTIEIASDQWFGVSGKSHDYDLDEYPVKERIYVQCDDIIDGVAAIWNHCYKTKESAGSIVSPPELMKPYVLNEEEIEVELDDEQFEYLQQMREGPSK